MRRRLEAYFPIVMLVLMTQLLAPISAARVAAQMVFDPLAMGSICAAMRSSSDSDGDPSQLPTAQHECCVVCALVMGGAAALDPPVPHFVVIQRHYQTIAWLDVSDPTELVRIGSNAQARAPPVFPELTAFS